jgi:hypothetical protein
MISTRPPPLRKGHRAGETAVASDERRVEHFGERDIVGELASAPVSSRVGPSGAMFASTPSLSI